ncbi:RNA-binding protein [Alginatibacterium sediminis]|uniref:RNA-binding protein n=1 Tax=Alginatibacterium sediminis TaxID=2164068 RepID=A0A420E628_9ALTE|nr:RNA-binding protein [Alginatibacterium sediminis]RKF13107.1 RNA-binding protein [Alginatibacterium sediminis]
MNNSYVPWVAVVIAALALTILTIFSGAVVTPIMVGAAVVIGGLVFSFTVARPVAAPKANSKAPSKAKPASDGPSQTLYVGNLPYKANESTIRTLFAEHGEVVSVRLLKDKHTGKRRGFGFVEMRASDAASAIAALNDTEFQQRTLKVREANERAERPAQAGEDEYSEGE